MLKRSLMSAGLVAVLTAAACGGDEPSSETSIPLSELPSKLATGLCSVYEKCYGPLFSLYLGGADCVSVTTQRVLNGTFPLLQGKIDQGKVRYDGTRAQACLDVLAGRTCEQLLDRDPAECLAALDGTVPAGDDCDLDEECQGSALCQSTTGTCPGRCVTLLAAGQTCQKDDDCQDSLLCSPQTKLCVKPAAAGESCDYNGAPPCGPGLLCLSKNDKNQTPGTCRTPDQALVGEESASCDPTTGLLCKSGLSCLADSYTAIPFAIIWKCVKSGGYAAGAACKPAFPDACAAGNYCKTGTTGLEQLSGSCASIPAAGEACSGAFGAQCPANAVCINGICQNMAQNGVTCTGDDMCYSGKCGATNGCVMDLPCQ